MHYIDTSNINWLIVRISIPVIQPRTRFSFSI